MKLMKKVLVLALAAATILMVACDNGNGGGGTSSSGVESGGGGTGSSGADGNGGGTNTGAPNSGTDTFVPPTLPESKGTDPFAGLKTLTTDSNARYQVDTTKKVLTKELSKDDGTSWSTSAEYSYSYDGTANPPTVTRRIEAQYLEKVWNSKIVQDMSKEGRDTLKKKLSMTPTYAVTVTEKSGTTAKLAVEGQYDSTLPWHEQTAGSFSGRSSDNTAKASFALGYYSVRINDMFYQVTEITEGTITCKDRDGTSKSFSYTTTGTGKDTVVTITVDSGKTIKCIWWPSHTIS